MSGVVNASFDALHLTRRVGTVETGARVEEVQIFAYFACILGVFDGQSVDSWGYSFVATGSGAPFATCIDESVEALKASGMIEAIDGSLSLSPLGEVMRADTANHRDLSVRLPYLDAAANTALALALPVATGAVMREPQLRSAILYGQRRMLLDDVGLAVLEPHFDGLRVMSIGQHDADGVVSLFSTAVLWLQYLRA